MPKWKSAQALLWWGLSLGLPIAIYKTFDNITVHHYVVNPDRMTGGFAYLILGGWTGTIGCVVFAFLFGRRFDPEYRGLRDGNVRVQRHAVWAGLLNAMSTLCFILGSQIGDPSVLVSLSAPLMIFTGGIEMLRGKIPWRAILPALFVAFIGSFCAASNESIIRMLTDWDVFMGSAPVILLVFFASNVLGASGEVVEKVVLEKKGVATGDVINLLVWRFLWLSVTGTAIAIVVSSVRGQGMSLLETLWSGTASLWFIAMTIAFALVAKFVSFELKRAHPVSLILLLSASQIFFVYPITPLANLVWPGEVSMSWKVWGVRFLGSTLLGAGIWMYYKWYRGNENQAKPLQ